MADRAHVTSIEAVEDFRASLVVFVEKARPALDDVVGEVIRTRVWLENDRRGYWENQLRRRAMVLDEAEQSLFGVRLSPLREAKEEHRRAVFRARQAVAEAEAKVRAVKRWSREYASEVEPLVKQLEDLRGFMLLEMPNALAELARIIEALAAYAGIGPVGSAGGAAGSPEAGATIAPFGSGPAGDSPGPTP
jgi:hypothetical protein